MKWNVKVVPVGDEDCALELPPDMLETLGWKTGDKLEWNETDEGITLTKVNSVKKVAAELDDEAFKVGEFIQELGKIQDQYFETLWEKVKDNKWIEGFESDKQARDCLFYYFFDGAEINQSFSEYCYAEWK